jgi:hypothetical protein
MKAASEVGPVQVGLGLRAVRGGGVVVGVAADGAEPRVVLSTFVATAAQGDRLGFEPYHVAREMDPDPQGGATAEAKAAVAEGRQRQRRLAAQGLSDIVRQLREAGSELAVAALLVNRAGWVTDLLSYSLEWREHAPVAEGLAVRDALRHALSGLDVEVAEVDETSLPELASEALDLTPAGLDARLKALGATAGRPWRREQKLACLSAWVELVARHRA